MVTAHAPESGPGDRRVWSRTLAALVAGLAATLALTVTIAQFSPLPPPVRATLAVLLAVPIWVGAAIYAYLARSARRSWRARLALALAAGRAASLS
jgi:hypothetical protein